VVHQEQDLGSDYLTMVTPLPCCSFFHVYKNLFKYIRIFSVKSNFLKPELAYLPYLFQISTTRQKLLEFIQAHPLEHHELSRQILQLLLLQT
jgi:hypothetical protein